MFEVITEKKMKLGAKISTKKHDEFLAKLFLDFTKLKGFDEIQPSQVDLQMVENFIGSFTKSKNYLNQSVRLLIKALDFAVKKKQISYNPIKEVELPTPKKTVNEIGLEMSEIEILKNVIPENKQEEIALDIFLFMCGTGVDFCDYNKLTDTNLSKIGSKIILRIDRQKTDRYNTVRICTQNAIIKDVALGIIEKYGSIENLPKMKYSHTLCKIIQNIGVRNGVKTHLTTKRGRKTFANISINYEMHTDEQTAYQMGHTTTNQLRIIEDILIRF